MFLKAHDVNELISQNLILRKNLGDPRVAYYIFEHGLPTLLDPPIRTEPPTRAMLENMLEECMTWHARLLRSLVEQASSSHTITARKLSDLNEKEWIAERRFNKQQAKLQLHEGARLARLRESGKFGDMSATEQRVLEDFDSLKLERRHNNLRIQKPSPCH